VLAGDGERLLVALPDLLGGDALFQTVVAGQEQVVDLLPCLIRVDAGYLR
jgi:hypothetical protein